jgi:lysophospholipase L1-like esterase
MNSKNIIKPWFTLLLALLILAACQQSDKVLVNPADYDHPVRVACVGNSITYGSGIEHRDSLSYPAQLQRLLGASWEVKNFGIGGRTLLSKGDRPYVHEDIYTEAKAFHPDVVLIKLGTNDTKPQNWQYKAEFKSNYKDLVHSFQQLPSKPKVILLKAVPAFPERWGISDSIIYNEMNPMVEELARELELPVIDLYTPLTAHPEYFPDLIHPNAAGAGIMAKIIYQFLSGAA